MSVSRRKFLRGAAAATGTAALGLPMIVKAQGPISMRWQSTWPAKDIFHEYATDFAKRVNDMTGANDAQVPRCGFFTMDSPLPLVSTHTLARQLDNPNLRLVDASWHMPQTRCKSYNEYLNAHLPGAVFLTLMPLPIL